MIERTFLGVTIGAVPVIGCFLAGWWLSIPLVPEYRIVYWALAGVGLGILIDAVFLRRWIRRAYSMRLWVWGAIYLFYSVGMLGLFMGVPVFNVLLALPAGMFVGRSQARRGADPPEARKAIRSLAVFTTMTLGLICAASAVAAAASPSTASDLRGLLGLSVPVTPGMIRGLIVGGGGLLLIVNWWLSVKSAAVVYRHSLAEPISPSAAV